jgi:iron complex outermembrane receptor protein
MKAHELLLSSGVMLGLLFAAPMAVAQDDGDDVLEEIVVTATRIETDLMSTSIAVSAFTQEQLTRDGVRDALG